MRVSRMGEKTVVICLTCSKRTNTMVKLCEIFESLNLKIISANIAAFSDWVLKTVFVQVIHLSLSLSLTTYSHTWIFLNSTHCTTSTFFEYWLVDRNYVLWRWWYVWISWKLVPFLGLFFSLLIYDRKKKWSKL